MDLIGQFSLCRVSRWRSNLISQGDMITCLATACCNLKSTNLRLCLRHNWSYSVPHSQHYPWHLFFSKGKIRWAGYNKCLLSQGCFHNQQALYQHLLCYLAFSEVIACTNHIKTLQQRKTSDHFCADYCRKRHSDLLLELGMVLFPSNLPISISW